MEQKKLGFGMMRLPLLDPNDPAGVDLMQTCRMVDTFLERGFSYFDTAYMYHGGKSENAVCQALVKRHPRDSYQLATKLPVTMLKQAEDMERIFNDQLEKCGVEYFDYYLLHCMNAANYATATRLDSFGFAMRKKKEGRIHRLGISYHDNAQLLDEVLAAHPEVEFVQLQLNYIDWDNANIQSRLCYEVCQKHKKPVIVMEPVKGGTLAAVPEEAKKLMEEYAPGMSPASWAIRFAASQKDVFMVLSGMSDYEQLLDNTGFMQEFHPLCKQETEIIQRVTDIINSSISIPCTGCRYCVDGCPQNIPIPQYFALCNQLKQFGEQSNARFYYGNLSRRFGKASDCIACGQCESHCPQHLKIIDFMKDTAEIFDQPKKN